MIYLLFILFLLCATAINDIWQRISWLYAHFELEYPTKKKNKKK